MPNNFCSCNLFCHILDFTFTSQGKISKTNLRARQVTKVTKKAVATLTPKHGLTSYTCPALSS